MEYVIVKQIEKYNNARLEIESCFTGLPHAHTTLMKSLITRANPSTGMVENLSYRDLAMLLSIDHVPGRKGAGIPKKETIRSYLRTIAENFPDSFKMITQGQKLKCQFTTLPKIYARFFALDKAYTDKEDGKTTQAFIEPIENIEETNETDLFFGIVQTVEPPIASTKKGPVKNINNKTNNNNNKKKSPIADDFVPTTETIARANALGYTNATNLAEIQAFIDHNKATGSLWADFNPIYLRWLARGEERRQQTKQPKAQKTNSGRVNHESRNHRQGPKLSPRERVIQAYSHRFDFDETRQCFVHKQNVTNGHGEHVVAATY
jgi:hypothetical protein